MAIRNVKIEPIDDNDKPRHLKPTREVEFEIWTVNKGKSKPVKMPSL